MAQPIHPILPGRNPWQKKPSENELIWREIRKLQTGQKGVVSHINQWVAKIQGIDQVAYAALYLHGDKQFELTPELVKETGKRIEAVLEEVTRYNKAKKTKGKEDDGATDTTEG